MPTGARIPVVIDPSQRRLGDFFKPFARQPTPSTPKRSPPTPVKTVYSSPNAVDLLSSSSPGITVTAERVNLSDPDSSQTKKKRARSDRDVSSDDELAGRSSKSPRASPSPALQRQTKQQPFATHATSSTLSSLQSPTPSSSGTEKVQHSNRNPSTQQVNASALTSTASFGSHSSFLTSSQRIIRDGETIAVRNSDDEASDDSIEDLDDLLGPSKDLAKESSPLTELSQTPSPPPGEMRRTRRSTRHGKGRVSDVRNTTKKTERKVKFDLATLSRRAETDQELSRKAEESMKKVQEIDEAREREDRAKAPSLEELIQRYGSAEGQERFFEALNRTEALQQTKQWYFFDPDKLRRENVFNIDLPSKLGSSHCSALLALCSDQATLETSLVSGVFLSLAQRGRLPENLAKCLWQTSIETTREDVQSACLDVLSSLPPARKEWHYHAGILRAIGANEQALDLAQGITSMRPMKASGKSSRRGRHMVCNLLLSVSKLPNCSSHEDVFKLLLLLLRLAADEWLITDIELKMLLSEAIQTLLETMEEVNEGELRSMYKLSTDDTFRLRILDAIPVTSAGTCLLRRRLATAWLFEDENRLISQSVSMADDIHSALEDKDSLFSIDSILEHFKAHPKIFSIRRETDYVALRHKTQHLSIAIGNGDPHIRARKASEPFAEKSFNAEIDRLADAIREVHNNIIDTGASHASRIEAKDALDSFNSRLLYSIRTKPRPRKDIIGGVLEDDDSRLGQRSMLQWLARKRSGENSTSSTIKKKEHETDQNDDDMEPKPKLKLKPEASGQQDSDDSAGSFKTPEDERFHDAVDLNTNNSRTTKTVAAYPHDNSNSDASLHSSQS